MDDIMAILDTILVLGGSKYLTWQKFRVFWTKMPIFRFLSLSFIHEWIARPRVFELCRRP
jgi:hypothetical protein